MSTKERMQALIAAMDSDELVHYGVKGMKWGKRKDKDILGGTGGRPHNGEPDEKNLIYDMDTGELLYDLSRVPSDSAFYSRFRDSTVLMEVFYKEDGSVGHKKESRDWASAQKAVNEYVDRYYNPVKKDLTDRPFNDHAKLSAKIEPTNQPNRREVRIPKLDSEKIGDGEPFLKGGFKKPAKKEVKHSLLSDILDQDVDSDELAHYGVLGMKWGVRKDRKTGKAKSAEIDVVGMPDGSTLSFLNDVPKGIPFNKKDDKALQKYASALYKEVQKDLTSKETDAYLDNVWDLATESVNRQPKPSFEKIEALYNKELAAYAEKSALRFIPETLNVRFQGEYVPDANAHLLTMTLTTVDTDKIRHASTGIEPKVLTVTYRVVFRNQHNVAELQEVPVAHSALTDLLNTEVDSDELAHYGVLGMKWGIRKSRVSVPRQSRKEKRESKELRKTASELSKAQSRNPNTFSNKPQNVRISNAELKTIVERMKLEQEYSRLTHVPQAPPSRVKTLMKDVAYDVTKGAATEVGKAILVQALKVEFNKRASTPYKVNIKEVREAAEDALKNK